MKTMKWLFYILLVVASFAIIGCSSDDDNKAGTTAQAICTPNEILPSNLIAPNKDDLVTDVGVIGTVDDGDQAYIGEKLCTYSGAAGKWIYDVTETCVGIEGPVVVASGVQLKFAAGATIVADTTSLSYISIKQGGQINAVGTAAQPIVFTSGASVGGRNSSDWGGIVIHGKAPVNNTTNINTATDTEIGTGPYGGDTKTDNSGTMQYVRVEFAGYEVASGREFNGIFLAGVGSGTTIDHVQIHRGSDDGIEIFGGTINLNHVVLTYNDDDGFDLDEGWSGCAHNFVIAKGATIGDSFIEYDGLGKDAARATQSFFSNFTFLGQGAGKKNTAVNIKASGQLMIINSLFANIIDQGIVHQGESTGDPTNTTPAGYFASTGTPASVTSGNAWISAVMSNRFENVVFGTTAASATGDVIYSTEDLSGTTNNFDTATDGTDDNEFSATMSFTAPTAFWGENGAADFKPAVTAIVSTYYTSAITTWDSQTLTPASYSGAIDPAGANWMESWTAFPEN